MQLPSSFFRAAAGALEGRRVRVDEISARSASVRYLPAGRVGAGSLERALTAGRARPHAFSSSTRRSDARSSSGSSRGPHGPTPCAAPAGRREPSPPYDGMLVSDARARRDRERLAERAFSATYLETYANCPYRYLLSEILRLGPLEEPERLAAHRRADAGRLVAPHPRSGSSPRSTRRSLPASADAHREALLAILEEELDARRGRAA